MIRWIAMLTVASACSPAPPPDPATMLCPEEEMSCMPIGEIEWLWRDIPEVLAPGEVVVEAEFSHARAYTRQQQSTYTDAAGREQACTEVTPAALSTYRVTRVVRGEFSDETFDVAQYPEVCRDPKSALINPMFFQLRYERAFGYDGPLYMVIRPIDTPSKVEQWAGWPIMTLRHNCDPQCQPHTLEPPPN